MRIILHNVAMPPTCEPLFVQDWCPCDAASCAIETFVAVGCSGMLATSATAHRKFGFVMAENPRIGEASRPGPRETYRASPSPSPPARGTVSLKPRQVLRLVSAKDVQEERAKWAVRISPRTTPTPRWLKDRQEAEKNKPSWAKQPGMYGGRKAGPSTASDGEEPRGQAGQGAGDQEERRVQARQVDPARQGEEAAMEPNKEPEIEHGKNKKHGNKKQVQGQAQHGARDLNRRAQVRQEVPVWKDTEIKPNKEPEIKHCKYGKEAKSRGQARQEARGQARRVHEDHVRPDEEPEIKPDKEPEIKHGRGQVRRVQEDQVRHVKKEPEINPYKETEIKHAKKQKVEDIADKELHKPDEKGQQCRAGSSCDQSAHVLERKPIIVNLKSGTFIAEQRRVEQPQPGDKQFIKGDRVKMHGVLTKLKEKKAKPGQEQRPLGGRARDTRRHGRRRSGDLQRLRENASTNHQEDGPRRQRGTSGGREGRDPRLATIIEGRQLESLG